GSHEQRPQEDASREKMKTSGHNRINIAAAAENSAHDPDRCQVAARDAPVNVALVEKPESPEKKGHGGCFTQAAGHVAYNKLAQRYLQGFGFAREGGRRGHRGDIGKEMKGLGNGPDLAGQAGAPGEYQDGPADQSRIEDVLPNAT